MNLRYMIHVIVSSQPMLSALIPMVWWSPLRYGSLKVQTYEILFLTKSLSKSAKKETWYGSNGLSYEGPVSGLVW